jgi:[ribosomal protein S18]-alanine N-acetyltransferase
MNSTRPTVPAAARCYGRLPMEIRPTRELDALAIATWRYEPPYSFYDASADQDDLALLLGAETREGRHFSAFDGDDELVGFFSFTVGVDEVVVGLGLRPDLTGQGLGLAFIEEGLAFARERFRPSRFRLSVATFNERAIRVYERAGFEPLRTYDHVTNGGIHPFLEMVRPA